MSKTKTETVAAVAVTVHPSVAGPRNEGTRRRAGHTFSVQPIHFKAKDLPKEVEEDRWLVKKKVQVEASQLASHEAEPAPATKPTKTSPDEAELAKLTELDNIGPGTAKKLLAAGVTREALGSGSADPRGLSALLALMQPAQKKAVLDATTPELREQLKAERIQ